VASLTQAKRLVVKIGSALLVDRETGNLRSEWLHGLAADVAWLRAGGTRVVLVSSGSIALGRGALGLPNTELALEQSQAAAAVGQIRLARAYEDALALHGITTAQVLMTLEDTRDRRRYLNSRATFEQLLVLNAMPIVNENDTVATDEIRFGDNLPKTRSGKIMRRLLRSLANGDEISQDVSTLENPQILDQLKESS